MAGVTSPLKGPPVSRPKMPHLSWRQARLASAAALTALLTTSVLTMPADAEDPPPRAGALTPSMTLLDTPVTSQAHAAQAALSAQSTAQAAAHRQALEKVRKAQQERRAREQAQAREHARLAAAAAARERAERQQDRQRITRSAQRPQAAPAATVSGARGWARAHLSPAQYQCLSNVVTRESGWNHRATNPSSGAYGLFQALPGSKMSSAGSDWATNPLTQLRWGLSYMNSRYGSPCGAWDFWTKNRWY